MKTSRLFLLITLLVLSSSLLSACVGGASAATSWPGLFVNEDTAYLADNQFVYAINLANGAEKWRYPAKAESKTTFFAPPVLTPNGQLLAGSYDHVLYSLDPANGQLKWSFDRAGNHYIASPLVTEQGIFAPNGDGKLYALDFNGALRWSYETPHPLWATPVTDGKIIYQPAMDHRIYAIDSQTGKLVWKTDDLGGAMVGRPTLATNGLLYEGTFSRALLEIDVQTGKVNNQYVTSGWVWSGPALDGDKLYFGDLDGYFYALQAGDLNELWKIQPDNSTTTQTKQAISDRPLVIQDTVYVTTESGNLYALNAADGSVRWTKTIGGKLYAAPSVAGDKILVAPLGAQGLLFAVDMSGNVAWTFTPEKK